MTNKNLDKLKTHVLEQNTKTPLTVPQTTL